jgi:hypothetical protein
MFRTIVGLLLALTGGAASAENWVSVFEDADGIYMDVDRDSIHKGDDGLVYFRSDGPDVADQAADCSNGTLYTLKLYVMDGMEYPDWRKNGRPVVSGSPGEATLNYACANR